MRIRLAIPDSIVDVDILDAALEATTLANMRLLASGQAPPIEEAITSGLRWKPENFGDGEHFDLAPTAHKRGWGDCDDLAPWLAAQKRLQGDHGARAFARRSGANKFHALVKDGEGRIIDPSRWAGMNGSSGIGASVAGPIACAGEAALALVPDPRRGLWAARADLPYGARHFSSTAVSPHPELAAIHAMRGAGLVSESCGVLGSEEAQGLEYLMTGLCGDAEHPVVQAFLAELYDIASRFCADACRRHNYREARLPIPAKGSLLAMAAGRGIPRERAPRETPETPVEGEEAPQLPEESPEEFPAVSVPARFASAAEAVPLPGGGSLTYGNNGAVVVRF